MTRTHDLKCWPEPFQAMVDGRKNFEMRVDDRGYAVGDFLRLSEWDPSPDQTGGPTGRKLLVEVTYLLRGQFGLPAGLVVMGTTYRMAWRSQQNHPEVTPCPNGDQPAAAAPTQRPAAALDGSEK